VDAVDPFRRRLKPFFNDGSDDSPTEFRLFKLCDVFSAVEGVPMNSKDSCDRANAEASWRRWGPVAGGLSTLPLILNLFLGVFILRLESIFMGVPANPFFVRFVGVGPAEAFSWLVPSSGLRRLAFGGVGRVGGCEWGLFGRGLSYTWSSILCPVASLMISNISSSGLAR